MYTSSPEESVTMSTQNILIILSLVLRSGWTFFSRLLYIIILRILRDKNQMVLGKTTLEDDIWTIKTITNALALYASQINQCPSYSMASTASFYIRLYLTNEYFFRSMNSMFCWSENTSISNRPATLNLNLFGHIPFLLLQKGARRTNFRSSERKNLLAPCLRPKPC